MNKIKPFGLLIVTLLFFSCSKPKPVTAEEVAQEVFELIKANDLDGLLKLEVTKEEMITAIGRINAGDSVATSFIKKGVLANLNTSMTRSEEFIKMAFNNVREDMGKTTEGSIAIVKITPSAGQLRDPILRLNTMDIEYTCNNEIKKIQLSLMYTSNGWKLGFLIALT